MGEPRGSFLDTLPEMRRESPDAHALLACVCEIQLRVAERLDRLVCELERREEQHDATMRHLAWEQGRLEQRRAVTAAKLAGDEAAWFRAELALRESFEDERQAERWIAERDEAAREEARAALRPALRLVQERAS